MLLVTHGPHLGVTVVVAILVGPPLGRIARVAPAPSLVTRGVVAAPVVVTT